MDRRFIGRVAVVTGGSTGLGLGTAKRLAAEGATVVLVARTAGRLAEAAQAVDGVRPGGQASAVTFVAADVSTPGGVERVRAHALEHAGPVDVVAAFAGGGGDPQPVADITPERWHEVIDANLTSTFLTVSTFLPTMLELGRGSILTMSSTAGRGPTPASPAYAAAKAGVIALTRAVALEAAPRGVRVNALAPASVVNDRIAALPGDVRDRIASFHPLGRLGTPDDVASAAAFLLSDEAAWITGVTLDVAGGRVMT